MLAPDFYGWHMKRHALSEVFPAIQGDELRELADDIAVNGLLEPIVTLDGEILDGWGRQRACEMVNVPPRYVDFRTLGHESPIAFVFAKNLLRRHLDASKRAWAARLLVPMLEQEADARSQGNLKKGPNSPQIPDGAPVRRRSREIAAAAAGVSPRTIDNAMAVENRGVPELGKAVGDGRIAVKRAAEIAKLSPKEQLAAMRREATKVSKGNARADEREDVEKADRLLAKFEAMAEKWGWKPELAANGNTRGMLAKRRRKAA